MSIQMAARLRPAIHPTYPRLLCAHLQSRGFDNATIFEGTRLHWEQLLGEHRYLSLEQMSRLIRRSIELTGEPWLGVDIGGVTSVSAHGPLGFAVVSAADLGAVLRVLSRFVGVRFQPVTVHLREEPERVVLTMEEEEDLEEVREYVNGAVLATFFHLIDTVTSRRLRDLVVAMPIPEPEWAEIYTEKLGCPVRFGTSALTIEVPSELLGTPCLTADPGLHRTALRDCEHQLRQLQSGGPLSQRIGVQLLECEGHYPSLDEMAARHAMSRRTLIRKLKEEGSSYQELLDEVRRELAAWYLLETTHPVERIAEKLGYQDPSNFSRTFQRWFGTTPLRMRKGE